MLDWIVYVGAVDTEYAYGQRFPQECVDDLGALPTGKVALTFGQRFLLKDCPWGEISSSLYVAYRGWGGGGGSFHGGGLIGQGGVGPVVCCHC